MRRRADMEHRRKNREGEKRLHVWIPLKLFADLQYEANMSGKTLTDYVIDILNRRAQEDGDGNR